MREPSGNAGTVRHLGAKMSNSDLGFKLTKQIEGIKRSMNRVTYESVAAMVIRMDEVSPVGNVSLWSKGWQEWARRVGYQPGQFRGNWQLGIDSRPSGWLTGNLDPSGGATVGKNLGMIPTAASRHTYYLVNNTPYGRFLEEGHSSQAPAAFILRAKREFNGMVRKVSEQIKSEGGRVR